MKNSRLRNLLIIAAALFVGAVVLGNLYSGYRTLQHAAQQTPASSERAAMNISVPAPEFTLINQDGDALSSSSLRGHVWVVGFVFTTCPGPCGLITQRMFQIQEATRDLPDFRMISITVDPEMDTPETLTAYAQLFKADTSRWHFLTGEPETVYAIIRDGFLQAAIISPEEQQETYGRVVHSTRLAIIDRSGTIRAFIDGIDEDVVQAATEKIRHLLAE